MPTTLITTVQGIGLGVMGQALAERVPEITRVIGVRRQPELQIDLAFPDRCALEVHEREIPPAALGADRKFLYIEQSYGLSQHMDAVRVFVPMWEQGLTVEEAQRATIVLCITRHTERVIQAAPIPWKQTVSIHVPWPIATEHLAPRRPIKRVKTILHNAGSLGGNLRKGTDAAIRIFQRSGLGQEGIRLVVHAWKPPTPELAALIDNNRDGIVWSDQFLPRAEDIYDAYDADLLLMPSKIEGHALVALEAMARGIPALVTHYAPINEYETDAAFLLPVERFAPSPLGGPYAHVDVDAGADRLRGLCGRDLSDKSAEDRDWVERCMSWRALGDQWRALCK